MDVSVEAVVTGAALLIFGVAFDRAVSEMEQRPAGVVGYMSLLVVAGVGITVLLLWPLVGTEAALTLLFGFACSGVPMVAGSVARHMRARDAEIKELRQIQADLVGHD